MRWRRTRMFMAAVVTAGTAHAATLVSRHGDWSVYRHDAGSQGRLCFAVTATRPPEPAAPRAAIHVYVSAWPKDGIKTELSVKLPAASTTPARVVAIVDNAAYPLNARGVDAFADDAIAELKLIEAMKKGSSLVVETVNSKGVGVRETLSLNGLTHALQALRTACG